MRSSSPGQDVTGVRPAPASFRDPSGFVFTANGTIYRQVNKVYARHYRKLMDSGLHEELVRRGWLVAHEKVEQPIGEKSKSYLILRPERVPFISYPYEWSFGQLKDAALLTLDVQRLALEYGMTLADASAYNVQYVKGRPMMIDTLSFQEYSEGGPWLSYRQFCQHFLAPIALMASTDVRLNQLLRVYIDGIPLDLASRLLPRRSWGRLGLATHIHLHARSQNALASTDRPERKGTSRFARVSPAGLTGLLHGLQKTVKKLEWKPGGTEWGDYYRATNYDADAFGHKGELISEFLGTVAPEEVWDLGANTGVFSRIAAAQQIRTVAFDIDPAAVEFNYQQVRASGEDNILPVLLDVANPSPRLGWSEKERDSFMDRGPVDCVMALALIHHLAISNNLPFDRIVDFFAGICRHLIIEFVPKSDSQVKRLLRSRADIFDEYDDNHFEESFSQCFQLKRIEPIRGSTRKLYLMEKLG